MSSQLYPLSLVAVFTLGMKSGVPVFDPATHPEGGVPAHVPDPAGVPELHDGQSEHDAAPTPNFPASHGVQTEGSAAPGSFP